MGTYHAKPSIDEHKKALFNSTDNSTSDEHNIDYGDYESNSSGFHVIGK